MRPASPEYYDKDIYNTNWGLPDRQLGVAYPKIPLETLISDLMGAGHFKDVSVAQAFREAMLLAGRGQLHVRDYNKIIGALTACGNHDVAALLSNAWNSGGNQPAPAAPRP